MENLPNPQSSSGEAPSGQEYPPETGTLMSWAAIQFIHRPRNLIVVGAIAAVFGCIAAFLLASFFYKIDRHVEAAGIILRQPVGPMLPEGASLVAVLSVDPKDVASVEPGQPLRHEVQAYPSDRYGLFPGKVLSIAPVAKISEGGSAYYEVTASIDPPSHAVKGRSESIRLVPGLTLRSGILTEHRTVAQAAIAAVLGRERP